MINSILEILRYKFTIVVADNIYMFFISNLKASLNDEFLHKLNKLGIKGILKIKNYKPAFWLINFERDNLKKNKYNLNFNIERNKVLMQNHFYLKGYKKRLKEQLNITFFE
jgi:hypothetical protein